MRQILVPLVLIFNYITVESQVMKMWEIAEGLDAPESVVYDSENQLLYVSNYTRRIANGSSYGDCFISKVSLNGKIVEKEWIPNLTSPTGLFLKHGLLYIVERFGVMVFDVQKNEFSQRYHIIQDKFINDLAVDNDNSIYVSQSGGNTLFRIKDGEVSNWIESEEIANANGINFIDGKIYLGVNGDQYLKTIDVETKEVANVAHLGDGNIDGIKKRGDNLLVSLYTEGLRMIDDQGNVKVLLDSKSLNLHCTDFEYIPEKDMIVFPTLYDNKLLAYKFDQ